MKKKLAEYPNLMLDWDTELNEKLNPEKITDGSHIQVTWKCHKCGKIWKSPVNRRTLMSSGCTCDAMERKTKSLQKKLVEKKGSLAENRPDIAKQWHPTKNGELTPFDITCGTEYKAWWRDSDGNEWQSAVNVRCRNEKTKGIPPQNLVIGKNDLATLNPKLAAEWDYEKNEGLLPREVMPHTKKKVWWKCYKGHEWQALISSRSAGRGCPECNKERSTSFPEQTIFYYAKFYFSDAENRYTTNDGDEIDVFLPSVNIGIEFDGEYYHKKIAKQEIDFKKNERLKRAGIFLIRVAERNAVVPANTEQVIRYDSIKNGIKDYDSTLIELFKLISGISCCKYELDINVERDSIKIWEQYIKD